jgi:hypothetical protein
MKTGSTARDCNALVPWMLFEKRQTVLADNLKALSFKRTSITNGKVRRNKREA